MSFLVQKKADLKPYNSMLIRAVCENLYLPYSIEGLRECVKLNNEKKIMIIGKGSNIILTKDYYGDDYAFIAMTLMKNIEYINDRIVVQCGTTMSELAWFALEKSVKGYEFLEDIPGTVGGGIIMNAGTYEDTVGALVESVKWYDVKNDEIKETDNFEGCFKKRDSFFSQQGGIVLEAVMKTECGDYEAILDSMLKIKKDRYMKQPRNYPSAGSVFKRPYKNGEPRYVWKLLDETGLRGYKVGDAQVSEKHPGFIVNTGSCRGQDILDLVAECKMRVLEKYDIELELEWKLI